MATRPLVVIPIVIVAAALILASIKTYYVRDVDNDGQLLWKTDEAYLFIGTTRLGWRSSYLMFGWEVALNHVRLLTPAQSTRSSLVVFTFSPTGIERHNLAGVSMGVYSAFDGRIYEGQRWRWSGTGFERTSADEEQRFVAAKLPSGEFSNVNEWSNRCCVLHRTTGETRFTIELGGQPVDLIVNHDVEALSSTVDLRRPNQPPQRIWSLDERPRRVSSDEYSALMSSTAR